MYVLIKYESAVNIFNENVHKSLLGDILLDVTLFLTMIL